MIREVIFLCIIASACCQFYPRQRAPPVQQRPPPEEYAEEEYAPPPRQAAPQPAPRANPRLADVYRPASVHYVNIGAELAGDYKFGYDTGKGNDGQSFREETRLPDGTVQGAYGYTDETGIQRIVKYTAGKEGFKVIPEGAPSSAPSRQAAPEPQAAYRPAPQQSYAPQPQPAPRPQPQPAYRAPQQPAYRAAPQPQPQPQPAYRPPPQPQPAYRAPPPQPARAPEPRTRSQAPRPQYAPEPAEYDNSQDYDYPNNDISERRLAPIDTSLFNYDIGSSQKSSK